MSIEAYEEREKMLVHRASIWAAEAARLAGAPTATQEALNAKVKALLNVLHTRLMANKNLANMAKTSDPQIFAESIFPKTFGDAAQDSYMESQETYTTLFEDQHKYNAIMSALAEVVYREMREQSKP